VGLKMWCEGEFDSMDGNLPSTPQSQIVSKQQSN